MEIFISWSGDRSRKFAELLQDWLQQVIQATNPWISSKDLDRGTVWFSEIHKKLININVGIICLTKENKNNPWILFESGALAKGLDKNRLFTFLIDLKVSDIENSHPLSAFNHTSFTKENIFGLAKSVNNILQEDKKLKENILQKSFDSAWEELEEKFNKILKETEVSKDIKKIARTDEDILDDILSGIRSIEKHITNVQTADSNSSLYELFSGVDFNSEHKNSLLKAAYNQFLQQNNISTAVRKEAEAYEKLLKQSGLTSAMKVKEANESKK